MLKSNRTGMPITHPDSRVAISNAFMPWPAGVACRAVPGQPTTCRLLARAAARENAPECHPRDTADTQPTREGGPCIIGAASQRSIRPVVKISPRPCPPEIDGDDLVATA